MIRVVLAYVPTLATVKCALCGEEHFTDPGIRPHITDPYQEICSGCTHEHALVLALLVELAKAANLFANVDGETERTYTKPQLRRPATGARS